MINIFNEFNDTVMYSDGVTLERKIKYLERKLDKATGDEVKKITMCIKRYKKWIVGEKKIIFELMNSHIPMYILHDLNFEYMGCRVRIDFVIITCKNYYIIECKSLYGNMSIDKFGNFFRGSGSSKRAIYNPIARVDRCVKFIREYVNGKNELVGKISGNRCFDNLYHGIVVLANDGAVINGSLVARSISERIVRVDKLVEYVKEVEARSENYFLSVKEIKKYADRLLALSVYNNDFKDDGASGRSVSLEYKNDEILNKKMERLTGKLFYKVNEKDDILRDKLREYRLKKSKELNYKPYYIFNDATMYRIIDAKPKMMDDLVKIHGIGESKASLFGEDILQVVKEIDVG